MPTLSGTARALHGLKLTAGVELVVTIEQASQPSQLELVVTTAGTAPVYWTTDNTPATVGGDRTRVIPAEVVAVDQVAVSRLADYPKAYVRVISDAAATISVQKG
ncbi:MAG: hypothetical protein EOP01_05605 [Propionibacteriaceae bacterium]|nr:MAG: hypothetical protein EOP01_05605 [Propionibacteriaceae bacterium]